MGRFARDRGVEPVTREHERVARQGEEPAVDRLDDRVEAGVLEAGVAGPAGEERVAAEDDRMALEQEARGAGRVPGRMDRAGTEGADLDDFVAGDHERV